MPIYQTNDYTLLQIKEKNFLDKFKSMLNKTWIIQNTNQNKHTHICIYTPHTQINRKKYLPVNFKPHYLKKTSRPKPYPHMHRNNQAQTIHTHTHTEKKK